MCLTAKPNDEWIGSAWKVPSSGSVAVLMLPPWQSKNRTTVRLSTGSIADRSPFARGGYIVLGPDRSGGTHGDDRADPRARDRRRRAEAAARRRRVARRD